MLYLSPLHWRQILELAGLFPKSTTVKRLSHPKHPLRPKPSLTIVPDHLDCVLLFSLVLTVLNCRFFVSDSEASVCVLLAY